MVQDSFFFATGRVTTYEVTFSIVGSAASDDDVLSSGSDLSSEAPPEHPQYFGLGDGPAVGDCGCFWHGDYIFMLSFCCLAIRWLSW